MYKEKTSFRNMYYQYMKRWEKVLAVFSFVYTIVLVIASVILMFMTDIHLLIIPGSIPFLLFLKYMDEVRQRILEQIYMKDSPRELFEDIKKEFAIFLENSGIAEPAQFEYLINLINKRANELKVPFWINRGIFASVFVSIWVGYTNYIFTKEVTTFNEASFIFIALAIFILACSLLFRACKEIIDIILDLIINADYNKMKKMNTLIEEIYLDKLRADTKHTI